MNDAVSFGTWVEKRRKALDLTREELALRVNCSISALRKIERDERRPSKQLASLLAEALEIPPADCTTFIKISRGELNIDRLNTQTALPGLDLLQAPRPRLPFSPTPLIGRQVELATINQLVADPQCRLVTLIGPGGIGKTRLATEIAHQQNSLYAQGAAFVSLASLASPSLIAPAIAETLDIKLTGSEDPKAQLLKHLRGKQLFLVLDNVEQLLDGILLVSELVEYSAQLTVLCTSRQQLNLRGEWVYDLKGLKIPENGEIEDIENYSAVALFIQCARHLRTDFGVTPHNRAAIARICRLVDGTPLAIELAATWVRALSCTEIAQEIESSIGFLVSTRRDAPQRHRSMQAVFDHSWQLLSTEEQRALRQLSLLSGPFTRQSAACIAGASLAMLAELVSHSLVQRSGENRYSLHELVRQYSAEKLAEAGETDQVSARHLEFFLKLAENAKPYLNGPQQAEWLGQLEIEHDNLRAALGWALENQASQEALQLCIALAPFWQVRGHFYEGRRWLESALQNVHIVPGSLQADALQAAGQLALEQRDLNAAEDKFRLALRLRPSGQPEATNALKGLGAIAWHRGEFQQSAMLYEEALAQRREQGDSAGIANILGSLGLISMALKQFERAEQLMEESIAIYRQLGDKKSLANTFFNLGLVTVRVAGKEQRAASYFQESVELSQEVGYRKVAAYSLNNMAMLALHQGDSSQASILAQESLNLCRKLQDKMGAFYTLINLGNAAIDAGDPIQARQHFSDGLRLIQEMQQQGIQLNSIQEQATWLVEGCARLALAQEQPDRALRMASAAHTLRKITGVFLPPSAQAYFNPLMQTARSLLDEQAADAAWDEGQDLEFDQILELLGSSK